ATFPNKAYLYHLLKKPILVSNATPLQRYVETTGGGLAFPSGDADALAELIRMLYTRPDLRREMANKGHQAVLTQYNWPQTAKMLITLYERLIESITEAAPALSSASLSQSDPRSDTQSSKG